MDNEYTRGGRGNYGYGRGGYGVRGGGFGDHQRPGPANKPY